MDRCQGVIAGAAMGLVLDGLGSGGLTQLPALVLLGWWWGRLGRRGRPIQRSLNLGLLAWIGAMVVGLSFWLQLRWCRGLMLLCCSTGPGTSVLLKR